MVTAKRLRAALQILVVLAFSLSLIANWGLYQLARGYITELQATRLAPLGLRAFPILPTPEPAGRLLVFAGDPRAAEWPAPAGTPFVFVNREVGGQTSGDVLPAIQVPHTALGAEATDGVVVLDSATLLSSDGTHTNPAYSRDSFHLTEAGYARLNKALTPLLLSLDDPD